MEDQTLRGFSKRDLERVLCNWANVQFPFPMVDYTPEQMQDYSDVVDMLHDKYKPRAHLGRKVFGEQGGELIGDLWLGGFLRLAWDTSDLRTREWYLFKLSDFANKILRRRRMNSDEQLQDRLQEAKTDSEVNAPPPMTLIEAAIYFFQRNAKRARRCMNVKCPAPYFFAAKRNQRLCSVRCARLAELRVKRTWATKNRAKLKQKSKSKGR